MINIELNNNKLKVRGNLKILDKVYQAMKVKHPNSFYLRPHMKKGWDGCIDYLTEDGYAKTGMLPRIASLIEDFNGEYIVQDNRNLLETKRIPRKIQDFEARDYQITAVKAITENYIGETYYPRGVINAATNAGKTIIAALLYKSFIGAKALILINNVILYQQFIDDMPKFFGTDWGYMQGKNVKWANIMVCMTPTLRSRLSEYKSKLATYNVVLFDECHLITSKTNKTVITALYNTIIRVGLSGTPFSHKDRTKNMDVEAFFGPTVFTIKNLELMEQGYSTPIIIKMIKGNTLVKIPGDYTEEYKQGITRSEERERALLGRLDYYIKRNIYPVLIIGKFIEHVERLYEVVNEAYGDKFKINYIHHEVKDRKKILGEFKTGTLDILVSSMIIKLGQNMPLIRVMINAASGDSHINALQLIGRAIRTHDSKDKVYYEDFADVGTYLSRHSKHRYKYYLAEGVKVITVSREVDTILRIRSNKKKPTRKH